MAALAASLEDADDLVRERRNAGRDRVLRRAADRALTRRTADQHRRSQNDRGGEDPALEHDGIITAMAVHVVLVHPEIHWNTGNAGRSCLAAGAKLHLVEPLGFSLHEREVRRAGLDYWEHVNPRVWPSWSAFETALPKLGEPFFFSTKATRVLWDAPLGASKDVVLVFGRETGGLPAEL